MSDNGSVSAFWSGALSALLGSLVGGIFTAVAALLQVRAARQAAELQVAAARDSAERQVTAAFDSASIQLSESYKHQVKMLHNDSLQRAIIDLTKNLDEIDHQLLSLTHSNQECHLDNTYALHEKIFKELYRFWLIYRNLAPTSTQKVIEELSDYFGSSKKRLEEYADELEEKRAAHGLGKCKYCILAEDWASALSDGTNALTKTLADVGKDPNTDSQ
jgi:hypothetical protein